MVLRKPVERFHPLFAHMVVTNMRGCMITIWKHQRIKGLKQINWNVKTDAMQKKQLCLLPKPSDWNGYKVAPIRGPVSAQMFQIWAKRMFLVQLGSRLQVFITNFLSHSIFPVLLFILFSAKMNQHGLHTWHKCFCPTVMNCGRLHMKNTHKPRTWSFFLPSYVLWFGFIDSCLLLFFLYCH